MIPLSRIPKWLFYPLIVLALGIVGAAIAIAARPDNASAAVREVRAGATSEQTAQETDDQLAQQMQSICSEIRGGHSVQQVGDEMSSNVSFHFSPGVSGPEFLEMSNEASDAGLILRSAVEHLCPEFKGELSR